MEENNNRSAKERMPLEVMPVEEKPTRKKPVILYNMLFPFWMLLLFPQMWLILLPGNFLIDSLVLALGMKVFKIDEKKKFYRQHIVRIFGFGMLSDFIGAAYMLLMMIVFHVGGMGDELYLTLPALLMAAVFIFGLNYKVTFRRLDRPLRLRLALMYAVMTAPYTFLIPSSWLYR